MLWGQTGEEEEAAAAAPAPPDSCELTPRPGFSPPIIDRPVPPSYIRHLLPLQLLQESKFFMS